MNDTNACRILFIDPDIGWIDFAVRTLKGQDFGAQGVTDIGKVRQASNLVSRSQLVFVDLEFAERSSDQFQRLVQVGNKFVVVLFPTGLTPHRMSRIFKLGAYDCVDKPYDTQSLVRLVTSLSKEVCLTTWDTASSSAPNCVPAA
ncbi:MAG: hypothetical protein H8D43_00495 [Chloroflexi bacterium]|nr:hypothetical protein [Chloroflexota bacterium]